MQMSDRLLDALRVLDLSCGFCGAGADAVTRLFADLGADVLKVEPPGGDPGRRTLPTLAGVSLPFAVHNANKRSTVLNPLDEDDRRRFFNLVEGADIVVDSGLPGQAAAFGTSCAELADRYHHLVALSVTDFGTTGPRSAWCATDPVLFAMSGSLSRSGPTTGTPVLPPDGIASATAAAQAAWSALVAYYNRLRCGAGDYIDFSRFDAVVMALDPAFGSHGQVAAGRHSTGRWRGRPKNQDTYPIYPCRDGYIRLCVMAPRQWCGLRRWLGEPKEFQDPEYDLIGARLAAWPRISELAQALFADQTMKALVTAGQRHGVPIAAVLTPSRILASEHFQAVGAITDAELMPGVHTSVPTGYFVVDGQRSGFRRPAPAPGQHKPCWRDAAKAITSPSGSVGDYPFEGLQILDLGIIVAGGEVGRLFGDLGAEVIKVESADYPDGLRQARVGDAMSESFARTHRNHLGLGVDLRSAQGKEIFGRLVAQADAVFANFKPGTLTSLGFSYDRLRALNPHIVLAGSSAYGDSGPWRTRMGYGPLVRAATGVTRLWTSDEAGADTDADAPRHAFYDATTIFPDHVVGRITAIGALAALIHRDRTGGGAHVHISQAEVVVNQLDTLFVTQAALGAGIAEVRDDTAVHGVYPCTGDDEWCVVSIRSDNEWHCVASVLEQPELAGDPRFATGESRVTNRAELVAVLSAWTRTRTPVQAAQDLQSAGVPAGPMSRPPDILKDPQLIERELFADMVHPLIDGALPTETGPAPFRHIPPAPQRPAPLPGQDTREICRKLLGMGSQETERLITDRILFAPADGA
ncbi:CoA transferase [Mycobacterium haemophilum]|uniref:Acyl-CoA transferase n=1 Tax=Mycobacterium haemophilum TaxID=29311 RepID=A0A0I9VHV8_9MYCO|nr:CoA transferase [Mycobacterium haemophilum]KLO32614.1 acyl-CoA transferase [Mycobacterium haemophilum]KLO36875.1 acyl-CoA transferase [Mycobacterium haemophilum]KLO42895.1 acyl-CoA transferase [Mycobacterium haemophilum]KLO55730.1 acyl-CoA transferase [Mycobacterium haemophilum]